MRINTILLAGGLVIKKVSFVPQKSEECKGNKDSDRTFLKFCKIIPVFFWKNTLVVVVQKTLQKNDDIWKGPVLLNIKTCYFNTTERYCHNRSYDSMK